MKSVLISIQPKWVEKIANGEKTIEVKKTRPKTETPFKCYIYRTTEKVVEIVEEYDSNFKLLRRKKTLKKFSGKVIGEFVCDEIEEFHEWELSPQGKFADFEEKRLKKFLTSSCLSREEVFRYRWDLPYYKPLYGWHISDLKIYDEPKELSEYIRECRQPDEIQCENCPYFAWSDDSFCTDKRRTITRPPKNWCYVEVEE